MQNEQICHNTQAQAFYEYTNFREHHFEQLPRTVPKIAIHTWECRDTPGKAILLATVQVGCPVQEILVVNLTFALVARIILDAIIMFNFAFHSMCGHLFTFPQYSPAGKETQRSRRHGVKSHDAGQQHSYTEAGLQISVPFLVLEQVQLQGGHSGSDVSCFRDQSPLSNAFLHDEGLDPIQCFDEDGVLHDDPIQSDDDDDLGGDYQPSCPPTILDGSESQPSQDYICSHARVMDNLPSSHRKRSAQQAFADELSQELHMALQYEYAPSPHHCSNNEVSTNEVASLQQCIYDGYHFADEYQQMQFAPQEPEQQLRPMTMHDNHTVIGYLNEANLEFHNF